MCKCGGHICSGAYANNVKCMYTSAPGHVDSNEFLLGTYIDMVASYLHMKYLAYVAFERHICCWHIYGNSLNKICGFY